MSKAQWAIAYHNTANAQKWYRVSRVVDVDGTTFELYWHSDVMLRGRSAKEIRQKALAAGLALRDGVYHDAPAPRLGSEMIRCK